MAALQLGHGHRARTFFRRQRLELLADSAQDVDSFRREVIAELHHTIGFERWCAPLVDPDSLIAHTGIAETDHIAELAGLQINDASLRELNNGAVLARSHVGVGPVQRSHGW